MIAALYNDENKKWLIPFVLGLLILIYFLVINSFTPDARRFLMKGKSYFDQKNYAFARQNFNRAIRLSQKSSGVRCEAAFFSAISFVRENRFQEGKAALQQFIRDYPNSFWTPQAYFDLAYCARNLGNKKEALRLYQKIIKDFPLTTWAEYSRDRIKKIKGKL